MDRRQKERDLFITLVNKQLEPFNVTYEDVKSNPDWYMMYRTTEAAEQEFIDWGTELIRKELKLNKNMARMEMSWFILQWGLTTATTEKIKQKVAKSTRTKKA
jgi:hypothetical protein